MSFICVSEGSPDDVVEIPLEVDGTLLLSNLCGQFPNASGLKFRNPDSGAYRGVRISGGVLYSPDDGWGNAMYIVVYPKASEHAGPKRKVEDEVLNPAKTKRVEGKCSDLIILGLPYSCSEEDVKTYFQEFGEVVMAQVKRDFHTGKSKGFGFVRFSDYDVQEAVLSQRHEIQSRMCDVRLPIVKSKPSGGDTWQGGYGGARYGYGGMGDGYADGYGYQQEQYIQKVFVGRLSEDHTTDDLKQYFSRFSNVTDVYIPKPFRAFGFITFGGHGFPQSQCGDAHIIQNKPVHVSPAVPREEEGREVKGPGWGKSGEMAPMGGQGVRGGMQSLNVGGVNVPPGVLAAAIQQNAMGIISSLTSGGQGGQMPMEPYDGHGVHQGQYQRSGGWSGPSGNTSWNRNWN